MHTVWVEYTVFRCTAAARKIDVKVFLGASMYAYTDCGYPLSLRQKECVCLKIHGFHLIFQSTGHESRL